MIKKIPWKASGPRYWEYFTSVGFSRQKSSDSNPAKRKARGGGGSPLDGKKGVFDRKSICNKI